MSSQPVILNLMMQVDALQQRLHAMESRLAEVDSRARAAGSQIRRDSDPLPKVFVAKEGSSDSQFAEQVISGSALTAYTDGRTCTSDSDPSALVQDDDAFLVIEQPDVIDSVPTSRYFKFEGTKLKPCVITGTMPSASGIYYVDTYRGSLDIDETTGLDLPEGLDEDTEMIAINPRESGEGNDLDGAAMHLLTEGNWYAIIPMGVYNNTDDEDDPDNGKKVGYLVGCGVDIPTGGLRYDVLTLFSDGGQPTWAEGMFQ